LRTGNGDKEEDDGCASRNSDAGQSERICTSDRVRCQRVSSSSYHHDVTTGPDAGARVLVLGEILWDVFADSTRLGGAPLNFAAQLQRLGHTPRLVSAVGADAAGDDATRIIRGLGLDLTWLQLTARFPTGTATVRIGASNEPVFTIERPAAYDAVALSDAEFAQISEWKPSWMYYGTLFPTCLDGKRTLDRLLQHLPETTRFYDLNLRPGFDDSSLVGSLLGAAHVVKLNADELLAVSRHTGLPSSREDFCRKGCSRFGWHAVAITLGARGCALLAGDDYVEAPGVPVTVVDTVGAGDAFAAAFVHGLASKWPAATIADFANRAGAAAAARHGAIPVP
jgi:fructokinase